MLQRHRIFCNTFEAGIILIRFPLTNQIVQAADHSLPGREALEALVLTLMTSSATKMPVPGYIAWLLEIGRIRRL